MSWEIKRHVSMVHPCLHKYAWLGLGFKASSFHHISVQLLNVKRMTPMKDITSKGDIHPTLCMCDASLFCLCTLGAHMQNHMGHVFIGSYSSNKCTTIHPALLSHSYAAPCVNLWLNGFSI